MNIKEVIYGRRTVRKFKNDPVSDSIINEILEAGTWAPSHGNNQPWEFVLIGNNTRKKLAEAYVQFMENGPLKNPAIPDERKQGMRAFAQNFGDAPLLLAVVSAPALNPLDVYDFPMSTAAAIQNIFLSAWDKGVGGVWLSFGNSPAAHSILEVAEQGKIAGILAMGYPEMVMPAQPRVSVADKLKRLP